jgi:hypothetical protein
MGTPFRGLGQQTRTQNGFHNKTRAISARPSAMRSRLRIK